MTTPSNDIDTRTASWLWRLPRLSFVLFIATVSALLWLSHRADNEEQRATLISDVLWLEQNLRFVLSHNEELLSQIGLRQASDSASFEHHARALINNQTGLRRVRWMDSMARNRFEIPESAGPAPDDGTSTLAHSLGRPVYGSPYAVAEDDWWFEVFVPLSQGGKVVGTVAGGYSLQRIIEESVPWWLAERYRIVVLDSGGKVLASRSKVEVPTTDGGYQLAFDPPGRGLSLQAQPYRSSPPLTGRLLSATLVLLAIVVLWSLWALRRHVQRRLAAEQALRAEYTFRKAMEDSLQTGLRARDLTGRITYVNPAFCAMVGWTSTELVGRAPPMPYWVDEEFEATRALHDRILAGEGPDRGFEVPFKRSNGEIFPALIHEAPLIDANGEQTGWMSSVVDISDQKRAEDLARQQQDRLQATARLVVMGEMASSLAHELSQPLAAIASYNAGCLNMIDSGSADPCEVKLALMKSAEQAQRAGRIIRRIYEFVRRAEPKSEPCDIGKLIEELIGFVEPDAKRSGVRIQGKIDPTLGPIYGDRVLLAQAIINLMRNGIDAMRGVAVDKRVLNVSAFTVDGMLHLEIADHGNGIPDEALVRLFEPFFTTKAEGMGMGLNICRSVVEGHKGRLAVVANPEGGSIFSVLLPTRLR
jgi:two-component system sensor histidine kinase DctS